MKAYTDIEQSKKLAEILPIETANMFYDQYGVIRIGNPKERYSDYHQLPVWSLAALIDVINNNYYTTLYHDGVAWNIKIIHHDNIKDKHGVYAGTPIDACYEMIIKLHEHRLSVCKFLPSRGTCY